MEGMGLKRSSDNRRVISNTFQRQIAFYLTNTWNEYSATQIERFHCYRWVIVTGMSVPKMFNKTHFDDIGVVFTGEYHGTAGTNARSRFISDLFPHMKGNWSEIFSCLHSRGSYPICAT